MSTTTATPTQTPAEVAGVKVGDFFYSSWGYDQTNVDFYKVVEVTKSGKSVKVQKWSSATVGEVGGPQENVVPGEGPATYTDWSEVTADMDYWERQEKVKVKPHPVVTKRLRVWGEGSVSFTVNSFSSASKWNGQPVWQTGYGWGH